MQPKPRRGTLYETPEQLRSARAGNRQPSLRPTWLVKAQTWLTGAALITAALLVVSWVRKGTLADPDDLLPDLAQQPLQTESLRTPFSFHYAHETYNIDPVAEYEMWGLVVTHNNTTGMSDVYHDDDSVDTKDLCVIWGDNVTRADYLEVEFDSGPFFCYFQYRSGVDFNHNELSNNHLITSDPQVRAMIADVRVGDQIHVVGSLVNYQDVRYPNHWRETSTIRDDGGNGACEVIFVDQIEVLQAGTPVSYAFFSLGFWLLAIVAVVKIGVFGWEQRQHYI